MMSYEQYVRQNPEAMYEDYENYLSWCEDREYDAEVDRELGLD